MYFVLVQRNREQCSVLLLLVWEKLKNLNLFRSRSLPTEANLKIERITTRVFFLFFLIFAIGLNIYLFFATTVQTITIEKPSISVYLDLYRNHNENLICPCSQISITYEKLINITYSQHEVCSSDLTSEPWLKYILAANQTSFRYDLTLGAMVDIRIIGASYFQLLNRFCSISKSIIDNAYKTFRLTKYLNDRVISSRKYDDDIEYIMASFLNTTMNDFFQMKSMIESSIDGNQFLIGINTNMLVSFTSDGAMIVSDGIYLDGLEIDGMDVTFNNVCSCSSRNADCALIPLLVLDWTNPFNPTSYFPDISIRCRPSTSLYRSKIKWWYDRTALNRILDTYRYSIPGSIPSPQINPLSSTASRYSRSSEILELVDGMFIETWNTNNSAFDSFYEQCAPISCSYTVFDKRDITVAVLLAVSILSGLNKFLQLIVPMFLSLSIFLKTVWQRQRIESGTSVFFLLQIQQG